ncbi:MAG: ATP-dependent zinc metalloprotease FtsH, partial [Cetobacterium sp.]
MISLYGKDEDLIKLVDNNEEKKEENPKEEEPKKEDSKDGYDELGERKKELKAKLKHGLRKGRGSSDDEDDEDDDDDSNGNGPKREKGGKFNFKGFIMLLFVITLFMSLPSLFSDSSKSNLKDISYTEFLKLAEDKTIKSVDEKEGYVFGYTS